MENKLLKKTASAFEFVDSAIQYVIEGGGKRFRPMLLLLSAKACEDESGKQLLPIDIYDLAVVVELI
ncbi:MAG: polyprenyl synthetase family protein, partial [Deltaproteobacteria bacterium]|nr:polyprenyl synthetase family protein [Deltaproteobacteria bacterium]